MQTILPRLFLVLMQIWAAWIVTPKLMSLDFIPNLGAWKIFLVAVFFALLVWLAGHVGGLVLKNVHSPSPATLSVALIGALIGAAVVFFLPAVPDQLSQLVRAPLQGDHFVLLGAIVGYFIKS